MWLQTNGHPELLEKNKAFLISFFSANNRIYQLNYQQEIWKSLEKNVYILNFATHIK